jgi:hypothetical protein
MPFLSQIPVITRMSIPSNFNLAICLDRLASSTYQSAMLQGSAINIITRIFFSARGGEESGRRRPADEGSRNTRAAHENNPSNLFVTLLRIPGNGARDLKKGGKGDELFLFFLSTH